MDLDLFRSSNTFVRISFSFSIRRREEKILPRCHPLEPLFFEEVVSLRREWFHESIVVDRPPRISATILFPLIFPLVPYLSVPLVNCPDLIVISCRSLHCLLVLPSCSVSDSTELLTIRDQDLFPLYLSIRKNIRTFVYLGRYCDLTC